MSDFNIPVTKTCTKCGKKRPATLEHFSRHRDCVGGLRPRCKDCTRAAYRAQASAEGRKPWPPVAERFWAKVDRGGPNECWEWQGAARGSKRYGGFSIGLKDHYAQRVAYGLANGVSLEDLHGTLVLHRCDNPPCCNPAHLFLGSNQDNMNDKVKKGRQARCPGEKNGKAVLSEAAVRAARARYAAGGVTYQKLADELGVTKAAVRFAVQRRTWRHVT